jgi:hypothetical protein
MEKSALGEMVFAAERITKKRLRKGKGFILDFCKSDLC